MSVKSQLQALGIQTGEPQLREKMAGAGVLDALMKSFKFSAMTAPIALGALGGVSFNLAARAANSLGVKEEALRRKIQMNAEAAEAIERDLSEDSAVKSIRAPTLL